MKREEKIARLFDLYQSIIFLFMEENALSGKGEGRRMRAFKTSYSLHKLLSPSRIEEYTTIFLIVQNVTSLFRTFSSINKNIVFWYRSRSLAIFFTLHLYCKRYFQNLSIG